MASTYHTVTLAILIVSIILILLFIVTVLTQSKSSSFLVWNIKEPPNCFSSFTLSHWDLSSIPFQSHDYNLSLSPPCLKPPVAPHQLQNKIAHFKVTLNITRTWYFHLIFAHFPHLPQPSLCYLTTSSHAICWSFPHSSLHSVGFCLSLSSQLRWQLLSEALPNQVVAKYFSYQFPFHLGIPLSELSPTRPWVSPRGQSPRILISAQMQYQSVQG